MGVCGARRIGRRRVRLGQRVHAGQPPDGKHLAGRFPWQNLCADGFERSRRSALPGKRLWPLRMPAMSGNGLSTGSARGISSTPRALAASRIIRGADRYNASLRRRPAPVLLSRARWSRAAHFFVRRTIAGVIAGSAPRADGRHWHEPYRISLRDPQTLTKLSTGEMVMKTPELSILTAKAALGTAVVVGGLLLSAVPGFVSQSPAQAPAPARKPNIVFIMGDDIGWMQPSIYHRGLMVGETPNIDRIGTRAPSSWTTSPCRAAPPGATPSSPACIRCAPA